MTRVVSASFESSDHFGVEPVGFKEGFRTARRAHPSRPPRGTLLAVKAFGPSDGDHVRTRKDDKPMVACVLAEAAALRAGARGPSPRRSSSVRPPGSPSCPEAGYTGRRGAAARRWQRPGREPVAGSFSGRPLEPRQPAWLCRVANRAARLQGVAGQTRPRVSKAQKPDVTAAATWASRDSRGPLWFRTTPLPDHLSGG
jgi:hypothetical protein